MFIQSYSWDGKECGDCHVPTLTEVNENLPLSEWKQSWDYEKKLLKQKGPFRFYFLPCNRREQHLALQLYYPVLHQHKWTDF